MSIRALNAGDSGQSVSITFDNNGDVTETLDPIVNLKNIVDRYLSEGTESIPNSMAAFMRRLSLLTGKIPLLFTQENIERQVVRSILSDLNSNDKSVKTNLHNKVSLLKGTENPATIKVLIELADKNSELKIAVLGALAGSTRPEVLSWYIEIQTNWYFYEALISAYQAAFSSSMANLRKAAGAPLQQMRPLKASDPESLSRLNLLEKTVVDSIKPEEAGKQSSSNYPGIKEINKVSFLKGTENPATIKFLVGLANDHRQLRDAVLGALAGSTYPDVLSWYLKALSGVFDYTATVFNDAFTASMDNLRHQTGVLPEHMIPIEVLDTEKENQPRKLAAWHLTSDVANPAPELVTLQNVEGNGVSNWFKGALLLIGAGYGLTVEQNIENDGKQLVSVIDHQNTTATIALNPQRPNEIVYRLRDNGDLADESADIDIDEWNPLTNNLGLNYGVVMATGATALNPLMQLTLR